METNFDAIKLAVEAATGGKNTVLFDDLGNPSIMVRIPKFKISDVIQGGSNSVHPAFIVNGVEKDEIFISKYQNIVVNDRAYSLPMQDPKVYVDFDTARKACENKGKGWHLMTNAEWAAIALWCKKNGYFPRGNNNYGSDVSYPHEKGVETYKYDGKTGRTGTGSGPVTWAHDGSNSGIFDLNGNVWEWVGGLRLVDGEIQVIADNNAACDADMSANSSHWKAIDKSGNLVAPKSANTLKLDYTVDPGTVNTGKGVPKLVTALAHQQTTDDPYAAGQFEDMTADGSITPPEILKALAIYPDGTKANHGDYIYMRNKGERLPFRGGGFNSSSSAGVFALLLLPTLHYLGRFRFSLRFCRLVILVSVFCFCHVSGNHSHQRLSWWDYFFYCVYSYTCYNLPEVVTMDNQLGSYETQLIIQQEVYDMLLYAYPLLDHFPKSQKFSLVQDIKKKMDSVLEYAIAANKKYTKTTTLEKMDVELAVLKVYVRLAFDLQYFKGENHYMEMSRRLDKVGKMLGGWIKAEKEKSGNKAVDKPYVCEKCGTRITPKSYEYSMKNFGKSLCYTCQKSHKD